MKKNYSTKILTILVSIALVIGMTGCGVIGVEASYDQRVEEVVFSQVKSDALINGNTEFAINLFKAINAEEIASNVFISPFSISAALGMVYNGARNDTKEAMAETLQFSGLSDEAFNEGFKYLNLSLNEYESVELNISNSIWVEEAFDVEEPFINQNIEVFNAYIESLDFSDADAPDTMNDWVDDHTKGLIDQIIEGPIDEASVLFLINTIYFDGEWETPFEKDQTKERVFTNYDQNNTMTEIMGVYDTFDYVKTDDYRAVRLPYGDECSMYCILPESNEDVNLFIENFNSEIWHDIMNNMDAVELEVKLPKLDMEYETGGIVDILKDLGMEIAFSGVADFSGIGEDVFISDIKHKAVIIMDEERTQAAAVTAAGTGTTAVLQVEEPPKFIANRPFMFIIVDDIDGSILFMGKIDTM